MIYSGRLSSGMQVLTEQIPEAISVSVGIWILRGSRSESEQDSGITHFIEHLFFKGSEKRTALDISREIESVGGSLNAFTSKEFLCLHARVLHSHLHLVLDLLSDIFLNPTFPDAEVERERQVILQEIQMIDDSPEELVHELFVNSYWRDHPLGRSTLGTQDTIRNLDRKRLLSWVPFRLKEEHIVSFFRCFYQPRCFQPFQNSRGDFWRDEHFHLLKVFGSKQQRTEQCFFVTFRMGR